MSKDDLLEFEGVVRTAMGNGHFIVDLENAEIPCQLAGKLRKNAIKVLPGDRVKISMSPYDLTHGLITYRMK